MEVVLERTKVWSCASTWPETKNDCADEDQQQIAALSRLRMLGAQLAV
jgi:hypothetical protein